ncbi:hypothetical protein DSO57_1039522 [Entomophthora muscae]|uniref:Uncharacterized protein n=1 Tax=Entomophthora muscae TaxID=34485 RepID=A0ACC2TWZ0_9FUNG|nr:hypothetical protein DSO57_1039522 [Entomophthora muscae]
MDLASGVGPSIGHTGEDFFQSDRDISEAARRASKEQLPLKHSPEVAFLALANATVREVNLKTRKTIGVYCGHTAPVTSVTSQIFENEVFVASGSWDKSVRLWNSKREAVRIFSEHTDFVKSLALGSIGNELILYSGSSDRDIRKWSKGSDSSINTLKGHRGPVEDLKFSIDQQHLFSCSGDLTIRKWCVHTDTVLLIIDNHLTTIYRLLITEDDVWSASADKTARRFDSSTGREDVKLEHPKQVRSLCITPDLRYLITGCSDENVRVFDLQTDTLKGEFFGHWDNVTAVHFQPSSSIICSASLDATIRYWNLSDAGKQPTVAKKPEKKDPLAALDEDELAELAELMLDED